MAQSNPLDVSHYDRLGAAFDRFLPFIQPVADAIIARLHLPRQDAKVVDIASGTGEPALTLARRFPDVRVIGIDAAEGMVAVAHRKVDAERLGNVHFAVMPLTELTLGDASVDAATSRFGFLLFGDPAVSAAELARVLKPGGGFSFAVWEELPSNTLVAAGAEALLRHVAPEKMPPFAELDRLAVAGRREGWLREAGMSRVHTELFRWHYDIRDFTTIWDLFVGPGLFADVIEPLDEAQRADMRQHLTGLLAPYRDRDGAYSIPQTCRLFWGRR